MTKFKILFRDGSGYWNEHDEREAHTAEQAVKASYLKKPDGAIVEMVAIPMRSWKPTPIRTETVQKVVLGGDDEPPQDRLEVSG